jgi:hypothetical protein
VKSYFVPTALPASNDLALLISYSLQNGFDVLTPFLLLYLSAFLSCPSWGVGKWSRVNRFTPQMGYQGSFLESSIEKFATMPRMLQTLDHKFETTCGKFKTLPGKFKRLDGRFKRLDGRFQTSGLKLQTYVL